MNGASVSRRRRRCWLLLQPPLAPTKRPADAGRDPIDHQREEGWGDGYRGRLLTSVVDCLEQLRFGSTQNWENLKYRNTKLEMETAEFWKNLSNFAKTLVPHALVTGCDVTGSHDQKMTHTFKLQEETDHFFRTH